MENLNLKDIVESKNYILTEENETHIINNINYLLNDFENILKSDKNNEVKIFKGSIITESLLNLIILKNGFLLKNNASFYEILEFSINNDIIPSQCAKFLNVIRIYKENTQSIENPNNLVSTFLNAFTYYLTWFDEYYSKNYRVNPVNIKNCCDIINLLSEDKLFSLDANVKMGNIFNQQNNFSTSSHLDNVKLDLILKQLDNQNDSIIQILEIVLKTLNLTQDINEKIDIIADNLNKIQSHTEKLIDTAVTEDELDRIIHVHTNQCIENIFEYKTDILYDDNYNQEKIKLMDSFGQNAWNKLSTNSKTFLITSKLMYNKLLNQAEIVDYSGICVLVTKALEVEIFKRFYTNFLNFLDEKYNKDYSKYHTALLFQNRIPLLPEKFTMGSIAYVLGYKKDRYDSTAQIKNNKLRLMEYCKYCIFSGYSQEKIEKLLNSYASSIEYIRINYRNPSAHRNQIGRINAKECFDLIVDVKKLLKQMLDSFDE